MFGAHNPPSSVFPEIKAVTIGAARKLTSSTDFASKLHVGEATAHRVIDGGIGGQQDMLAGHLLGVGLEFVIVLAAHDKRVGRRLVVVEADRDYIKASGADYRRHRSSCTDVPRSGGGSGDCGTPAGNNTNFGSRPTSFHQPFLFAT